MITARTLSDAGLLAEMLRRQPPGPVEDAGATAVFEGICGRRVRAEVLASGTRPLEAPEYQLLHADGVLIGHERWCLLRTDAGEPVAETTAILHPCRVPAAARAVLGISRDGQPDGPATREPLGKALKGQGATREPREVILAPWRVDLLGEPQVIYSAARLWLRGMPIGLVTERVYLRFLERFPSPWPGLLDLSAGSAATGSVRAAGRLGPPPRVCPLDPP